MRRLTSDGAAFRYDPTWSPDSKHIAFTDKSGAIYLHTIDRGTTKQIDVHPWAQRTRLNWSHDAAWLAYTKAGDNRRSAIWLYQLPSGKKHQVTSGQFDDSWPTFDRKGEYLYFASSRNFNAPLYEDLGTTFIYSGTEQLLAVPAARERRRAAAAQERRRKLEEVRRKEAGRRAARRNEANREEARRSKDTARLIQRQGQRCREGWRERRGPRSAATARRCQSIGNRAGWF